MDCTHTMTEETYQEDSLECQRKTKPVLVKGKSPLQRRSTYFKDREHSRVLNGQVELVKGQQLTRPVASWLCFGVSTQR